MLGQRGPPLSALDDLVVKALDLQADKTVLASRASEWSHERNRFINDCTGDVPTIVILQPFNEIEQQKLFSLNAPKRSAGRSNVQC